MGSAPDWYTARFEGMILPPQRGQNRPRVVRFSTSSAKGLSSAIKFSHRLTQNDADQTSFSICVDPRSSAALYFLNTTKIEQKIATGGANRTSTPMLKLRIKRALVVLVRAARHIEHCAPAYVFANSTTTTATTIKTKTRRQLECITVPPTAAVRLAVAPGSGSAARKTESCRGKTQTTAKYKPPAPE